MLPLLAAYIGASALGSLGSGHGLSQVPLVGGFFNDPAQDDLEQSMKDYGAAAQARAPWVAKQWQNLRGQVEQAYGPTRTALNQMYNGQPVPQQAGPVDLPIEQGVTQMPQQAPPPGMQPPPAYRGIPGADPRAKGPVGPRGGY